MMLPHQQKILSDTRPEVKTIIALDSLIEIPGESKLGFYHPESGEITEKQ